MNNYIFSPSDNMFYPIELRSSYEIAGTWPADSVLVDDAVFAEFTGLPPEGKVRTVGEDGLPAWEDVLPPTQEEITNTSDAKKTALRAIADAEIEWRQDAVDADIATDDEIAVLVEWKKYRVLLMRVDTTDPEWPTPPATQAS